LQSKGVSIDDNADSYLLTASVELRQRIYQTFLGSLKFDNILDYGGGISSFLSDVVLNSNVEVYDVGSGNFKLKSYDLIYMGHVLEHVNYPVQTIKEILPLMLDNSIFIGEVPMEHVNIKQSFMSNKIRIQHEHINFFSLDSVRKLCNAVDLELLSVFMHYGPDFNHIIFIACKKSSLLDDKYLTVLKNIPDFVVAQDNIKKITRQHKRVYNKIKRVYRLLINNIINA
jgi:hypothetical protein